MEVMFGTIQVVFTIKGILMQVWEFHYPFGFI